METTQLTQFALANNKAIAICKNQLSWWQMAPRLGMDAALCKEQALIAELALLDLIDNFDA